MASPNYSQYAGGWPLEAMESIPESRSEIVVGPAVLALTSNY